MRMLISSGPGDFVLGNDMIVRLISSAVTVTKSKGTIS